MRSGRILHHTGACRATASAIRTRHPESRRTWCYAVIMHCRSPATFNAGSNAQCFAVASAACACACGNHAARWNQGLPMPDMTISWRPEPTSPVSPPGNPSRHHFVAFFLSHARETWETNPTAMISCCRCLHVQQGTPPRRFSHVQRCSVLAVWRHAKHLVGSPSCCPLDKTPSLAAHALQDHETTSRRRTLSALDCHCALCVSCQCVDKAETKLLPSSAQGWSRCVCAFSQVCTSVQYRTVMIDTSISNKTPQQASTAHMYEVHVS